MCAGNQCCPGINNGPTFPCPSAKPGFGGCGVYGPSCVPLISSKPGVCHQGDAVQCPHSDHVCAGNQCCPGMNNGPTVPCPSAQPGFRGCGETGPSCVVT